MTPEEQTIVQVRLEALRLADKRSQPSSTPEEVTEAAEKLIAFLLKGIKVAA